MTEDERIAHLLNAAPGPSPWYPLNFAPKLVTRRGSTRWESIGESPELSGKIALKAGDATLCVLNFYNWVMALDRLLLIWHQGQKNILGTAPLSLIVLDCDRLKPIEDIHSACREIGDRLSGSALYFEGDPVATAELPTSCLGSERLILPESVPQLSELLILCHSSAVGKADSSASNLAVMVVRPQEGMLELIPQDWFNLSGCDFGYQWVTRVARDPETGRVIADGIRIDPVMLDESARNVEKRFRRAN